MARTRWRLTVSDCRDLTVSTSSNHMRIEKSHIKITKNKANSMMVIIRRTFDHMDEQCFTTIVKSLVRPHIEYANQVWTPLLLKHITARENIQCRATKLIPDFKYLDYKERLQRLKCPTLAYCQLRGNMT